MIWPDANGFQKEFYTELLADAAKEGYEPEWLLGVSASESGLDPTAYNKNGGAAGLTQCMPQTLRNMGVDVDSFRQLPAHVQIKTSFAYFREWRVRFRMPKWTSRAQMYLCNFLPALLPIATVPDTILVSKQRAPVIYNANAGLDANHDAFITLDELEIAIDKAISSYAKKRYQTALASLAYVQTGQPERTILDLQTALESKGFDPGPLDGQMGPKTAAAVRAFQSANALTADGVVGPLTAGKLYA